MCEKRCKCAKFEACIRRAIGIEAGRSRHKGSIYDSPATRRMFSDGREAPPEVLTYGGQHHRGASPYKPKGGLGSPVIIVDNTPLKVLLPRSHNHFFISPLLFLDSINDFKASICSEVSSSEKPFLMASIYTFTD